MTVEELEIIIRANITDAMSGIKQVTEEVKKAVSNSIEPMKQMTTQAKSMAKSSGSSVSQMKQQMKSYKNSINDTTKQQEYLKSKIEELKYQLSRADLGFDVGDTLKIEAEIERLENKLQKLQSVGSKNGKNNFLKDLKKSLPDISKKIDNARQKIKSFTKAISGVGNKISKSFGKGIKSLKSFALRLVGIRAAITGISKAASAYLSFDNQLSDSITNSWNMLGSLLAPTLELVANLFAKATNYAAYFVKTLTGIDLVAKANAKALNSQTSASNKASKSLSSLDEIENLNTDDTSSDSDISQIETESINTDSIFSKVAEALKNGEYFNAGKIIAEQINASLDSVNWEEIKNKAKTIGTDIALFLNGGITSFDWNLVGSTLANGINTAINFAYGFITAFNWVDFGLGIANSINGFFSTIDWSLLGQTISNGVINALNSINTFLSNVNWEQIGEDIKTFLINIDWATIFNEVIEAVSNIVGGVDGFLTGVFGEGGATEIEALAAAITTIAVAIGVVSTALGIYNTIMAITTAVSTPVLSIIMLIVGGLALLAVGIVLVIKNFDKIKSAFSTVCSVMGKAWDFLWNGIKSTVKTILNGIISYMNLWIAGLNAMLLPVRGMIVAISKAFGKSVSLSSIKIPSIPKLETGGVLTQKSLVEVAEYSNAKSNPEIVSPRSIMKETMLEAFSEILPYMQQSNEIGDFILNLDSKEFARAIYEPIQNEGKRRNTSTTIVRS